MGKKINQTVISGAKCNRLCLGCNSTHPLHNLQEQVKDVS